MIIQRLDIQSMWRKFSLNFSNDFMNFSIKKGAFTTVSIYRILYFTVTETAHQHTHKFLNQIWLKCASNSKWWQNTLERNVRHRERKIKENRHETLSLYKPPPPPLSLFSSLQSVYPFEFVCRLTFGSFLRKFSCENFSVKNCNTFIYKISHRIEIEWKVLKL